MEDLISAYIPCYNNASTIARSIESIRQQTAPVDEIFVVDDGSTDGSGEIAESIGVRVIRHPKNLGRGAVRARAMIEVKHEFVLCCDGNKTLPPDFVRNALNWFQNEKVAAAVGRMTQSHPRNIAERWRGRHLFKTENTFTVRHKSPLATWGTVVRKSVVMEVGNYNKHLRHSEDFDLGEHLLRYGYDVIFDPDLQVISNATDTVGKALERYWRWYAGKYEEVSIKGYLKQIIYSVKVMAMQDLKAGDMLSIPISLFCAHYQFWRSYIRKRKRCEDINLC